ncbi:hypothetical protein ACJ6WD_40515 [Streptomyces sp. VTCC 41912]|uniref:hypothetical protein n=1 Tax=Streptomyces sp. VTCC 41912 TaxID=3383243 RepID=UPI003896CC68
MPIQPWRAFNPDAGDNFLIFQRRFRHLVQDPAHTIRVRWEQVPLICPLCEMEEGLRLAHRPGDREVQAQCPAGHTWATPLDISMYLAYCRIRWGAADPDWLWLLKAGYGEEPAPPIDHAADIRAAAAYMAKYGKRKAKARVKKPLRKAKKMLKAQVTKTVHTPARKVGRRVKNEAMRPVAGALRAAWAWQAGGVQPVTSPKSTEAKAAEKPPPPVRAYMKAYGMEPRKKGPKCLVCEDTGRITSPGIAIPCPQCAAPSSKHSKAKGSAENRGSSEAEAIRRKAAADIAAALK